MINKILITEDEKDIREFLSRSLTDNGYSVMEAEDGIRALELVRDKMPDLVLLDLGLPKMSGESVCREIKRDFPKMPVIMLTGKVQSTDLTHGLEIGADDYIEKPFKLDELLARIKARLRDAGAGQEVLRIADLELNDVTKEVKRGGQTIILTPKEYDLLYYLINNIGHVLSRDMILNKVWLYSPDIESRVVDVYIGYLRRKIDGQFKKKLIHSIRGFGYTIKK